MRLYIVRHSEAAVPAEGGEQSLTPHGRKQATRRGQSLLDEDIDCLVHSPKLRARQTAELIHHEIGAGQFLCDDRLVPSSEPSLVEQLLDELIVSNVLLVSHLPLVANLAEYFVSGSSAASGFAQYSPTGLVVLEFDVVGRGCGQLLRSDLHVA